MLRPAETFEMVPRSTIEGVQTTTCSRYVAGESEVPAMMPLLLIRGSDLMRTKQLNVYIVRVMISMVAMSTWFAALAYITVGEMTAITFLSPILATIGAAFFLREVVSWHWCNAMNQAALSLPALTGLADLYGLGVADVPRVFAEAGIDRELLDACAPLRETRFHDLPQAARQRLEKCAHGAAPARRELAAFLHGEYVFDPACLTD